MDMRRPAQQTDIAQMSDAKGSSTDRSPGYDAFISYSHALDGTLTPTFQRSLETFGKPWYRRRALKIFRDTTSLSANPGLWSSIEAALRCSEWLILMASPAAARSTWVDREVSWWLENKSSSRLLIILVEGEYAWVGPTAALPPATRSEFPEEPRWEDLRWLRDTRHVDHSNPRFRDIVAGVASAIRGVPKDQLVGEHIRQHRRAMRLAWGGAVAMSVLLVLSIAFGAFADTQWNAAQDQLHSAIARRLIVQSEAARGSDPRTALRLGLAANAADPEDFPKSSLALTLSETAYNGQFTATQDIVAFSPDRATLAAPRSDGAALWDFSDRMKSPVFISVLAIPPPPFGGVRSLVFSPNGRTLALGAADKLYLWDVTDRNRPRELGPPLVGMSNEFASVAFSPDGRTLVADAGDHLSLWNVSDPVHPALLPAGIPSGVNALQFSSDGRTLAVSDGTAVTLWNMTNPARPVPRGPAFDKGAGTVEDVLVGSGGRTIATVTEGAVQLWNATDQAAPRKVSDVPVPGAGGLARTAIALSSDARTLATGGSDRSVTLWDISAPGRPRVEGTPLTGATDRIEFLAFSPDDRTLVSVAPSDGGIEWNLDGRGRAIATGLSLPVAEQTSSLHYGLGGREIVTNGLTGMRVWAADAHPDSRPLLADAAPERGMAFAPDQRTLAEGIGPGVVMIGLAPNGRPVRVGSPFSSSPIEVSSVDFSPDGRVLAVANDIGDIQIWDVSDPQSPELRSNYRTHPDNDQDVVSVGGMVFSADGAFLVAGLEDGHILTLALTPEEVLTPTGNPLPTPGVEAVALSPDGRTLATNNIDETTTLWDLSDPVHPNRLGIPLIGSGLASAAAFSADGRTLAVGGNKRKVMIWDITDRAHPVQIGDPLPTSGPVNGVDFAPDGTLAAVVGGAEDGAVGDDDVRLWRLSSVSDVRTRPVGLACAIVGAGLSAAEWSVYAPELPFRASCGP